MKKLWIATAALLLLVVYIASPYYSAYRLIEAAKSGSEPGLRHYVDFESVQSSLKSQLDKSIEQTLSSDPMASMFSDMLRKMSATMVEQIVRPEVLAEMIRNGRANPRPGGPPRKPEAAGETSGVTSWYAFFDRPNRFKVKLNELVLYMHFRDFHWQLTDIGLDNLIGNPQPPPPREPVADEIDPTPPASIQAARGDLSAAEDYVRQAFHIDYSSGDTLNVKGEFYYFPFRESIEPSVHWTEVINTRGESVLGEFPPDHEKTSLDNSYSDNVLHDRIPVKPEAGDIDYAKGVCSLQIPTAVDSYKLSSGDIKTLHKVGQSAVNLKSLRNGGVALDYYNVFALGKIRPQIIVRNAAGQVLKTGGYSSFSRETPLDHREFTQPMRAVSLNLEVKGTPASVEINIPVATQALQVPVITYPKPKVSFGKLKSEIRRIRLAKPVAERPFESLSREKLRKQVTLKYIAEKNWDKTTSRYLELNLPDAVAMQFATPDYTDIVPTKAGKAVPFRIERTRWNGVFKAKFNVKFNAKTGDWSRDDADYDALTGSVKLTWPTHIETFTLAQGDTRFGATLLGPQLIYKRNQGIPDYSAFGQARAAIAFDKQGRVIETLDSSSSRDEEKVLFWGAPTSVEIKRITKQQELSLPVELTQKDLEIKQ